MAKHPDLFMKPDDRIALIGPNGFGKSTLINSIIPAMDFPEEKNFAQDKIIKLNKKISGE